MSEDDVVVNQQDYEEDVSRFTREERNQLLLDSDWTQLSDVNQRTRYAYVGYRQALRDLPNHANWPFLNPEDWPKKPNV